MHISIVFIIACELNQGQWSIKMKWNCKITRTSCVRFFFIFIFCFLFSSIFFLIFLILSWLSLWIQLTRPQFSQPLRLIGMRSPRKGRSPDPNWKRALQRLDYTSTIHMHTHAPHTNPPLPPAPPDNSTSTQCTHLFVLYKFLFLSIYIYSNILHSPASIIPDSLRYGLKISKQK